MDGEGGRGRWRGFFDRLGNLTRGRGARRITAGQAGPEAVVKVVKTRHLGGSARRRGVISLEIYPFCRAWGSGTPPREGWSAVSSTLRRWREDLATGDADEQGFRQVGQPRRLLVKPGIRASGRQAQAVTRAARVSRAPVSRRLGPFGRPIIIEVAILE